MTIRRDAEDIWYWYKKIREQRVSDLKPKEFCDENHLDLKKFCRMKYRIEYKSESDKKTYEMYLPLTREYITSGIGLSKFCRLHNLDINILGQMRTHLGYKDIIEKRTQEQPGSMNFIQVPTNLPAPENVMEPEVIKKQNEVELIISAGVKVVVAPEVGADKLVRIIQLLKDL